MKNRLNTKQIRESIKKVHFNPDTDPVLKVVSQLATKEYCVQSARLKLEEMKLTEITDEGIITAVRLLLVGLSVD